MSETDMLVTSQSSTGRVFGLYLNNGQMELRYKTVSGQWAIARHAPQETFDDLITKYAARKVKEGL